MATNNPRVAAYLLPKNFERLKAFSKGRGLSLSQAIDTILSEYFGGESPSNTPQIEARLAALEASLGKVDSLNFEVVVTNEAIAAIQADLARLNSVLFSSTSTAPDPQTNSRVSEPLSSTPSDEVALPDPQTTPSVSEPFSSTLSPQAAKPDIQTQPIISELLSNTSLPDPQTNSLVNELLSNTSLPDPQTKPIISEPLSSTDETQPNPSSGEAGELLSRPLGSTSDSPSPEPLVEKDALKALASVEPNPSGDLEADVLLNDTLSDSPQLGSDEAESADIPRIKAVTSEPPSSLLKSEDENGQLYQQAIKRAKELKKKRLTQSQMADTLNAEGFTTITGKKWTRAAISRLFG